MVEGEQVTVLELKVAPSDLGKVIGKQGRTARSVRTILGRGRDETQPALHAGNSGVSPQAAQPDAWITLAVLGRTRGNRGELTAVSFSKPERFAALEQVWLFGDAPLPGLPAPAAGERFEVETTWFHNGTLIFKLRGRRRRFQTAESAGGLQRCVCRWPISALPLEAGRVLRSPTCWAAK